MGRRGRPPTPDILTPREWEVLDLLRAGLTNQQIADRLEISLSGAKHHVSEIISKLGVESRDEAAAWERVPARRWGFTPLAVFEPWRSSVAGLFATKVAVMASVAAAVAAAGIAMALILAEGGGSRQDATAFAQATPPCRGCILIEQVEYTTVEEAAAFASFVPMLPDEMPEGFGQHRIVASKRDFSNPYVPEVHNDWVTIEYRDDDGERLVISQGFSAQVSADVLLPSGFVPDGSSLRVAGREAVWSSGVALTSRSDGEVGTVLTLYVGRFASGWGADGSWFSGSPMTYSIASGSLDLEALVAIAESVTFPSMLPPLNGAVPESIFE